MVEPQVLTVSEFCALNRIGRTTFYKLVGAGAGPRLMRIGKRVLIPIECAKEWRQARTEQPARP